MIVFLVGTPAELIKVSPVMKRLEQRDVPHEIWSTYQHTEIFDRAIKFLSLPKPSFSFARGMRGQAIAKPTQMLPWLFSCFVSFRKNRRSLRLRLGDRPLVIVHGDTVTTVFGALVGRLLRVPVAHIEAGLRSGNIFRPFPEEIDRRIVGHFATIHFAPNAAATHTLRKKDVVDTKRNTAIDGVLDVLEENMDQKSEPFGLVLLHRFELMSQPGLVRRTFQELSDYSPLPLFVITDVYSDGPILETLNVLNSHSITPLPKLAYPDFVRMMANADFVVTDSGGAQQELGLLGTPTLLHREVTESPDGLGANVVLSGWKEGAIRDFMRNYDKFKVPLRRPEESPSDIIVASLESRGFLYST